MPRRRTSKATSRRPKPKLPDQGEEPDMNAITRREKLELLIKDFDDKAQSYRDDMISSKKCLLSSLKAQFQTEMLNLKPILNMKVAEFLNTGGSMNESAMKDVHDAEEDVEDNMEDEVNKTFNLDVALSKQKRVRVANCSQMDTISEEDSENQPPRTTRRKVVATGANTSMNTSMNTSKTSASRQSALKAKNPKFMTPYHGYLNQVSAKDTPLQTPRFDPRLPMTPGLGRQANIQETHTQMALKLSVQGSPIAIKQEEVGLFIGGAHIPEGSFQEHLSSLNPQAVANLKKMSAKLSAIFQMKS